LVVSFLGSVEGGLWERAAQYTPAAMVGEFQHGLLRLDTTFIAIAATGLGLALAAVWMRLGVNVSRRLYESAGIGVFAGVAIFACTFVRANWDFSESRGNSFPAADERALQKISVPLKIEAHLAPEDPRRVDLESHALSKLRRIMRSWRLATSPPHRSDCSNRRARVRRDLVSSRRPKNDEPHDDRGGRAGSDLRGDGRHAAGGNGRGDFPRHPLAVPPKGAGAVFYVLWL